MNLQLAIWPNPILHKKAVKVEKFDDELKDLAQSMIDLMLSQMGVGLAAPQVSVLKNVVVLSDTMKKENAIAIVNPEILTGSDKTKLTEGCLSFPGIYTEVDRYTKIKIRYQDLEGNIKEEDWEGFKAHILQHETEHLRGITLDMKMTMVDREVILKPLLKDLKKYARRNR